MKFFKVATTNFKKCNKSTNSSVASTSTIVTSFLNESKPKTKSAVSKIRKPPTKKVPKKSKTQPDIRKAISKREKLFNHVLTENCQQDGLDPDEVQMALAISESMMDQGEPSTSDTSKFDNPFNSGNGKVQSISTVLERYGFKCKKNYTEYELGMITNTKLSTKKSRFMKVPTELTRTTAKKREEMIRLRVMDIMDENHSQKNDKILDDEFNYEVSSLYLQDFHEKVHTTFAINSDDRTMDDSLMLYYVQQLFEPSFVKADHLLKDWKKVPGRESTPDKDSLREIFQVTQTSSQIDSVEMIQMNSVVCSENPKKDVKETEDNSETTFEVKEVETKQKSSLAISHPLEVVKVSEKLEVEENSKNLDRMILTRSCSDLFADSSDIANCSDFEDSDDICEIPLETNSEELDNILASQLQSLHSKLSLSVAESQIEQTLNDVNDVVKIQETPNFLDTIDELEANLMEFVEDVSLVDNECVDLTQMVISRSIQGDNKIDLTQEESADEIDTSIPIDDSLISLQVHMKKLEAEENASRECRLEQKLLNSRNNTSIVQINILSSDEEDTPIIGTVVISSSEGTVFINNEENVQNDEEDLFKDQDVLNSVCTNNFEMEDEECEVISDEEINYSIKKFYSYNECQASQESQESQKNEIISPEAANEDEDFFEMENWRDDIFADSMIVENNFNINDTVMSLLETSVIPQVSNKKDHSTRFHDSEILSESIREILKKYQDPKLSEVSSRSLRKMQSDTNLLNQSRKQRKSVHFNFNDDFNESINNPSATLEDSFTWRLNDSLHEQLNDSIEKTPCSPIDVPKKKKQITSTTAPRLSLGISKDNDYIIDASMKFPDPDFHSMTPVELKQQLFKIGVRTLPVKKAIELLEYIYEQLHPQIRIAADEEIDINDSRRLMNATDIITSINCLESDDFVFVPGLVEDEDYVLPKMRKTKVRFLSNFLLL